MDSDVSFLENTDLCVVACGETDEIKDYGESICIFYLAEGTAAVRYNSEEMELTAGNVLICRPGNSIDRIAGEQVYQLQFRGENAPDLLEKAGIQPEEKMIYVGVSAIFGQIFRNIAEELQEKRYGYESSCVLYLRQLLLFFQRSREENKILMASDMFYIVDAAKQYFDEHYDENISIREYAGSKGISPGWFIRNFKDIIGLTPMHYIIRNRIKAAEELLRTGDNSIKQIAEAVGYDNSLYFSRIFSRFKGISPKEFRAISRSEKSPG